MNAESNTKAIEDAVRRSLEDLTGTPRNQIKLSDRLRADLKLDGDDFTFVLVPQVEKELGVKTSPTAWRNVFTVQEAIDVFAASFGSTQR
jgi:acyl carrier protein